jgi:hypothetical protein
MTHIEGNDTAGTPPYRMRAACGAEVHTISIVDLNPECYLCAALDAERRRRAEREFYESGLFRCV